MNNELKTYNLSKLNPLEMGKSPIIEIIGRRQVGKSVLIKDLLYYYRDIPIGTVVENSGIIDNNNQIYNKLMPTTFIHNGYNPKILNLIIERQITTINDKKKDIIKNGTSNIDLRYFLILDDAMYDNSILNDNNFNKLISNRDYYNTLCIISHQILCPELNNTMNINYNIDYVFLFNTYDNATRKNIYKTYQLSSFISFGEFCHLMDTYTNNYGCLVINNNTSSNKVEDRIFWYRANKNISYNISTSI